MRIGIIGTGNIGGALTRRFTELGHDVVIANSRGPESLAGLAAETGAKAGTVEQTARHGEVVVVTIPEKQVPHLPAGLFADVPASVVVIDTGNYYPRQRDGRIEPIEDSMPESVWVSGLLGRPVVKAFNNIHAAHLLEDGKQPAEEGRIALPVAGDDEAAKRVVMDLVDEIGFDPVDAGPLAQSWRQQPGTPVYGTDLDSAGVHRALALASETRPPDFRGTDKSPGDFAQSA